MLELDNANNFVMKIIKDDVKFDQILGRALGGKVTRSTTGWDLGVRTITLSPSLRFALSSLDLPSRLSIIECHRDEVCIISFQLKIDYI